MTQLKIAFAVAGMIAAMTASIAKADFVLSTEGSPNGNVGSWGTAASGSTPTYGELFVDPAGNPFLKNVEFLVDNPNGSAIPFKAYIYSWNGSNITGSALFTSGALSVAPTAGAYDPVDVSMNVQLTPGNQYVALFSTVGLAGNIGSARFDLATTASYTSGLFEYNNDNALPPAAGCNPNGNFGDNLAFSMTFSPPAATVPEPSSVLLLGTIALMLWRGSRRRFS